MPPPGFLTSKMSPVWIGLRDVTQNRFTHGERQTDVLGGGDLPVDISKFGLKSIPALSLKLK